MSTPTPERADLDAHLAATAVDGSAAQGAPGHDQAGERSRAIRALTLRAAGMTYAEVADNMGFKEASSVRQLVLRALDRHEADSASDLRDLENARLDRDEMVLTTIIQNPGATAATKIRAIDSRTRLSARRARMNGLDAPVAVQISAGVQADLHDALREVEDAIRTVVGEVEGEVHDEPLGT